MTEERKIEIQEILKKDGEDLEKLLKKVTKAELVEVLKELSGCVELQKNNIIAYNVDRVESQKIIDELKENISSLDINNNELKKCLDDTKFMYNNEVNLNTNLMINNNSLSKQLTNYKIIAIISTILFIIALFL